MCFISCAIIKSSNFSSQIFCFGIKSKTSCIVLFGIFGHGWECLNFNHSLTNDKACSRKSKLGRLYFCVKFDLRKNNFMLKLGAYNQSPDFYMAGSEWGFISDRLGGKIGVDYKH